jgi:hypothetical protein
MLSNRFDYSEKFRNTKMLTKEIKSWCNIFMAYFIKQANEEYGVWDALVKRRLKNTISNR